METGRILPVVSDEMRERIVSTYAEVRSMQRTSVLLGVGYGTVQRTLVEARIERRSYGGETEETKVCIHCGREKPLAEFRPNYRKIGRRNECERCFSIIAVCRRYGITREQYEEMWTRQGGRCAICNRLGSEVHARGKAVLRLAVDHDHETGVVRGLLCNGCNLGLGGFDDDPEALERAAAYLRVER
jgi:hypothetical protein